MNVFNDVTNIFNNLFGVNDNVWVQRQNISQLDLDICKGTAVKDKNTNTCVECVALNKTVFLNNNKPEFTHPKCKCKNVPYKLKKITLDFSMKKIIEYLFVDPDKKAMMETMGYLPEDSQEVYDFLSKEVIDSFRQGNYMLQNLDKYGQRFRIFVNLIGKRHRQGQIYKVHAGCVAYPSAKIKIATPVIKD